MRAFAALLAAGLVLAAGRAADAAGAVRVRPLARPPAHAPGFTKIGAAVAGIAFTNRLSDDRAITNRNLLSGAGVAIGDADGDGVPDLFLCGIDAPNALYRNLGGWKFEDVTDRAFPGISWRNPTSGANDSTGAAFADVDGDGDLDLLVDALGGGTRLFRNDGRGRFEETTAAAGLASRAGATSLALADVDGDGDLDLYVAHFRPTTVLDAPNTTYRMRQTPGGPVVVEVNGRAATAPDLTNRFEVTASGEVLELGEADRLYLNDGKGLFTAVPWTGGAFEDESGKPLAAEPRDWGLAVRFHDMDGDGRPDLYVCNDLQTPDRVWINAGARGGAVRLRAVSATALRDNPTFSMGVDFGDFDRDGNVDLIAVDMFSMNRAWRQTQMAGLAPANRLPGRFADRAQVQRNVLQIGRGDGTWADTAWQAGVAASEWSWGPVVLDVDLDGFEDILVPNGQLRDFQDGDGARRIAEAQARGELRTAAQIAAMVRTFPALATPNAAFRNRGDATFEPVSARWGFTADSISQGVAVGDLDGDGDLDVVMNDLRDAPALYRNDADAGRVLVRLRGDGGNTRGVGARVTVRAAGLPDQSQEIAAGGRYLGGDEPARAFATGTAARVSVEVRWGSGRVSTARDVPAGSAVEIDESGAMPAAPAAPAPAPWFRDVSDRLRHVHVDEPFDDFARQPMLPAKQSQGGPGVTWTDLDGDGYPDLVVGAGRGGRPGVFMNDGRGGFSPRDTPPFHKQTGRDLTAILPLDGSLLAGVSNYEDGATNGGVLRLHDPASGRSGEMLAGAAMPAGPLAAADVDGDGEAEIVVGGRAWAGRYPEAAPTLMLRNTGGRLAVARRWGDLGPVNAALFTDLDGDGRPDLVLAAEWSAPRFLRNEDGVLVDWTPEIVAPGGVRLAGWWNAAAAGDFDGDGRMDLVLGNHGRNTRQSCVDTDERRLHHGDLGSGAGNDVVETWFDRVSRVERPEREYMLLASLFPHVRERAPTFAAYAAADYAALFGDRGGAARSADTMESMVLLNRGGKFEARPLPAEAQRSPVFGLCVADFDGDGHEDLFLSQNTSAQQPFAERADAGRGLWLRGDGHGGFVPERASGIAIHGDGRGAAVADFDGDGRTDIAAAQNGAATMLWRNERARPGVRVRVSAADAVLCPAVRLRYGARAGPWREIRLGSGYWSCDDTTAVLGRDGEPTGLETRWPGLPTHVGPLAAGQMEIRVVRPPR